MQKLMFEDSRRILTRTTHEFARAGKTKAGMSEALGCAYARTSMANPGIGYKHSLNVLDFDLTEGKMPVCQRIKASIRFLEASPKLGHNNLTLDHLMVIAHALKTLEEQHGVYVEPEKLMLECVLANPIKPIINKQIFVMWLKDLFAYLKIE